MILNSCKIKDFCCFFGCFQRFSAEINMVYEFRVLTGGSSGGREASAEVDAGGSEALPGSGKSGGGRGGKTVSTLGKTVSTLEISLSTFVFPKVLTVFTRRTACSIGRPAHGVRVPFRAGKGYCTLPESFFSPLSCSLLSAAKRLMANPPPGAALSRSTVRAETTPLRMT